MLVASGVTSAVFGGLGYYSYLSKKDFTFLGGVLFSGLLSILLLSIISLFIQAEIYHLVLAWLGVIVFSSYVLFDISRIKYGNYTDKDVPALVFDLFLDFLNLFLDILRIIASIKSDD